jgi:hypothetical protein
LPWDESGGFLLAGQVVSGAEVARARFRLRCGTWEPLASMWRSCVDAVGVRENLKQRKLRGGEYRCGAAGRAAS